MDDNEQALLELIQAGLASGKSQDRIVKELNEQHGLPYDYARAVVARIIDEKSAPNGSHAQPARIGHDIPGKLHGCVLAGILPLIAVTGIFMCCSGCFFFVYLRGPVEGWGREGEICITDFGACLMPSVILRTGIILFGISQIHFPVVIGVLLMRKWGWVLFMIAGSFWFSVFVLLFLAGGGEPTVATVSISLSLMMGVTLWWFYQNRWRFV